MIGTYTKADISEVAFQDDPVHEQPWRKADDLSDATSGADLLVLGVTTDVLRQVRRAKSGAAGACGSEVTRLTVREAAEHLAALGSAWTDLKAAGSVRELVTVESAVCSVDVELADEPRPVPAT